MSILLTGVLAKLKNVNPRAEIHGADTVLGCDLKLTVSLSNDVLEQFEKGLKAMLYCSPETQEDLLFALSNPPALTKLRFPLLGGLKHGYEGAGYQVKFDYGVDSDILLPSCGVDGFTFECKEGGAVLLGFRVKANPDEDDIGRLCGLIQHEVTLSITPPPVSEAIVAPVFEPEGLQTVGAFLDDENVIDGTAMLNKEGD
jgi:hypothetical protein